MYLLDTNACIALIHGKPPALRRRVDHALSAGHELRISSIVAFELCYGVAKSARPEANTATLKAFFAGPLRALDFDFEDARFAGTLRAALERKGKPIGAYDLLIAGQALRHQLTLVTSNVREFPRIAGLHWEDWGK